MIIEEKELSALLESRKEHIGRSLRAEVLSTAGAVGVLISAYPL